MKIRQKQKLKQFLQNEQQSKQISKSLKQPIKSFRSKMFQNKQLKPIPKVNRRQITLHIPPMQQYLNKQIKFDIKDEVPQLWGCINVPQRKTQTTMNYLGQRKVNTPDILLTHYMRRKQHLNYNLLIQNNQNQQPNTNNIGLSEKFLQKKRKNKILQSLSKSKKQQSTEQGNTDKFTSMYSQRLQRVQNPFTSDTFITTHQLTNRINHNKSIHQMNLKQLQDGIKWKKRLLSILTEGAKTTREKYN